MSKKEKFIELVKVLMENVSIDETEWGDALIYFKALQMSEDNAKPAITDKGKDIILFIQNNYVSFNNMFSSKQIADGMGVPTKSVSASMRGLVSGGYLEKISDKPVIYSITEKGKDYTDTANEA